MRGKFLTVEMIIQAMDKAITTFGMESTPVIEFISKCERLAENVKQHPHMFTEPVLTVKVKALTKAMEKLEA